MPVFKTFSERRRLEACGAEPEVYVYDEAPDFLRHQVCLAVAEGFGQFREPREMLYGDPPHGNQWWEMADRVCRKELSSYLDHLTTRNLANRFLGYVHGTPNINDFLSAVEIACRLLSGMRDNRHSIKGRGAEMSGAEALEEINARFVQHAVGYQFENGWIIRIDSTLAHAEIVKPALRLLAAPAYRKANDDFMTAHRHYRAGEHKDAVVAAHRAYESMLKAICDAEKWAYSKGDSAGELVTKVSGQGLFTHDFDRSFTSYVSMLKTGLPAVRNDAGGHGEGMAAAAVTPQIARFAINLTASNLLFLGECHAALRHRGLKRQ